MSNLSQRAEKVKLKAEKEPLLIPLSEAAQLLSVSVRTIYRLADAGKIPKLIKLGHSVRVRRDALLAIINQA